MLKYLIAVGTFLAGVGFAQAAQCHITEIGVGLNTSQQTTRIISGVGQDYCLSLAYGATPGKRACDQLVRSAGIYDTRLSCDGQQTTRFYKDGRYRWAIDGAKQYSCHLSSIWPASPCN